MRRDLPWPAILAFAVACGGGGDVAPTPSTLVVREFHLEDRNFDGTIACAIVGSIHNSDAFNCDGCAEFGGFDDAGFQQGTGIACFEAVEPFEVRTFDEGFVGFRGSPVPCSNSKSVELLSFEQTCIEPPS